MQNLVDESICIGPAEKKSYLHIPAIIAAAEVSGADAIHPGYGFYLKMRISPEVCAKCNITFIGPTPDQMRKLGEKVAARDVARKAGLPFTRFQICNRKYRDSKENCQKIGFPSF